MGFLSYFTPFAFVTGGFFSGLAGFIGMKTATMANCRTANAASESLNRGLRVAFSAGSVMGFTVVGLGLLDLSFWYFFLRFWYTAVDPVASTELLIQNITSNMLTFGMGASSMAPVSYTHLDVYKRQVQRVQASLFFFSTASRAMPTTLPATRLIT